MSRRMQLRHLFVIALALAALAGCEANVFPVQLKGETTIQGDPSPLTAILLSFQPIGSFTNIDFNQSQEFQNQGITKDQVKSVRSEYLRLRILFPDTQDFSFLDWIEFSARAGDLNDALLAGKHGIAELGLAAPNPVLELEVSGEELQPYVTAPTMSIIVQGSGKPPPQDTRIEVDVGLKVEIRLF
jgi:hypothetical protein